jgi:hypothetical protein
MKKTFTRLWAGILLLPLLSGCASAYHPVKPEALPYSYKEVNLQDQVSLSYMYDGLALRGNKKYVKREMKNAIKVVGVKIENSSAYPINVGEDCRFYMGDRELNPIDPNLTATLIKQPVPIYLLYSLLNFTFYTEVDPYTNKPTNSTFIPSGPFIAVGNMVVAGTANTQMRKELIGKSILAKTIAPGQTAYGLLCLRETSSGPIKIRVNKKPEVATN